MKRTALIAATVALCSCAPNFSEHPSAEEVLSALDSPWIGMKHVEQSLATDHRTQDAILGGICTATPRWLEVAQRLRITGNAEWDEQMSNALAVALTREPAIVLKKFGDVCGEPDQELPVSCAVPHWKEKALAALKTVNDPALAALKAQCVHGVNYSVGLQSSPEPK